MKRKLILIGFLVWLIYPHKTAEANHSKENHPERFLNISTGFHNNRVEKVKKELSDSVINELNKINYAKGIPTPMRQGDCIGLIIPFQISLGSCTIYGASGSDCHGNTCTASVTICVFEGFKEAFVLVSEISLSGDCAN